MPLPASASAKASSMPGTRQTSSPTASALSASSTPCASCRNSIFKGLVASGWHTAAITMRLFVQTLKFAEGAIGLGVDELRWPNAVRPGDELRVEPEIVDLRESRSKPDHGIVRIRNITKNQRDEIVQSMFASALVPRRKL